MSRRETIKNPKLEQQHFVQRSVVAASTIILLVLALIGRMAYLQIFAYEHFAALSKENRVRVVAVPPPRGLIYDRNGIALAENIPAYRLEMLPSSIDEPHKTLIKLAELIPIDNTDIARFNNERHRVPSFQSVPIRLNLTEGEVAQFAVNRHRFPGVEINVRLMRYYPQSGNSVHVLGYIGRINGREHAVVDQENYAGTSHIGKLGIEKYYEDILHGRVGRQHVEINAQGRSLRILDEKSPVPGGDLMLSLDSKLQRLAENALGVENGAVVAMDPKNGEVLVLASTPTYDPNLFVNGIGSQVYKGLQDNPGRPLFNRALSGQYPPGSTIKPFIALAGLESGVTKVDKTLWAGPTYSLPNGRARYRDWKPEGHGEVDMAKAITQSCDVYFYDLAHKLGIDRIHDFLDLFALGRRSGVDLTGEARGLLPSPDWKKRTRGQVWYPGETVITGIGQGYLLVTPLQLAVATSMIAMHGKHVTPRLLRAFRDPQTGKFTPAAKPESTKLELKQSNYWEQVIKPMVDVTLKPNGTAFQVGRDAAYTIAGKTGTAQVFKQRKDRYRADKITKNLRDHALFIAFAPADDPQIVVAVLVENAGHGGSVAAPIARKVMDYYLLGKTLVNDTEGG